jgi:anti-sigma factor RsiW
MTIQNLHLTHEQLCDLILANSSQPSETESRNDLASDSDIVHAHLRACAVCSAELATLRDSIAHFRDASTSFARQEFAQGYAQRSIAPPHSVLSQPLYWAAAALVFVAALFPLSMRHQHSSAVNHSVSSASSQTQESDEALLADIDQDISADVPASMEPLANPTTTATTSAPTSSQRSN